MAVPLQDVQQRLIASRQKQAYNYNLKGKALPELQPGQIVRMKKPNENTWTEAVCKKMIGPQSYTVVCGNHTYRTNCRQLHLVPTTDQAMCSPVSSKQSRPTDDGQVLTKCASPTKNSEGPKPVSADSSTTALTADLAFSSAITRSGHTVRPPVHFQDYMT